MKRVKGIYENHVIKLFEQVDAEDGSAVEVIFTFDYQDAKARQFKLLNRGFRMGQSTRRNRTELHER